MKWSSLACVTPQDLSLQIWWLLKKSRCSFNFHSMTTICPFKRRSVCISQPPKTLPAATSMFFLNYETLHSPSAEIIPKLVSAAAKNTINQCPMSALHLLEICLLLYAPTNLRSCYLTDYFTQVWRKNHVSANWHSGKSEVKVKVKHLVIVQKKLNFKAERSQFILTCQKRIQGSFPTTVLWQQAKRKAKSVRVICWLCCGIATKMHLSQKMKYTQKIKYSKGSIKVFLYRKFLA